MENGSEKRCTVKKTPGMNSNRAHTKDVITSELFGILPSGTSRPTKAPRFITKTSQMPYQSPNVSFCTEGDEQWFLR